MAKTNEPQTLPTELERAIFEIAAPARPLSIPKFMLVAWRVTLWLEPLLYETIAVGNKSGVYYGLDVSKWHPIFPRDLLHLLHSPSARIPGVFERHLFLAAVLTPVDDARALLSTCRRIENLWINTTEDGVLFSLIEDLPLTQLYCNIHSAQQRIDFSHRLFSKLTHLEVFDNAPTTRHSTKRGQSLRSSRI
ncbi:hypothetical protein B0H19DRAFT_1179052 [Mycena capillaripes]|nr:hypothetical protein B0H19DRAFT_1179052 [Mycena capillaripes]